MRAANLYSTVMHRPSVERRPTGPAPPGTVRRCVRLLALAAAMLLAVVHAPLERGAAAQDAGDGTPATSPNSPPRPVVVPAFRQADDVFVLTIRGGIGPLTLQSLERRIATAKRRGADAIVLDIDTPGGRLDVTLDICDLLKDRGDTPANTVAWINPDAYSAGTIIAVACREIVTSPDATFGDAAPIQGLPVVGLVQMPAAERAKVEAPLIAELRESARLNGYDENLLRAFASVGVELWMVEHVTTGERIFIDRDEYETAFGEAPPDRANPVAPPDRPGGGMVRPKLNDFVPRDEDAATAGLDEEAAAAAEAWRSTLPPQRDPLDASARDQWRLLGQVVAADELLTLKTDEARYYGLSAAVIADDEELRQWFGARSVVRLDRSWSESIAAVLVSTPARIILILVFVVGLFLELAAPGLGVFGGTALVALALLVGAPVIAGMADWWEVLLVGIGLILVALEIFVIPGTGVAGFAGAACLLVGLVGTFVSGDVASPQGQAELWTGVVTVVASLFGAGVAVWILSRQFNSLPMLSRFVLRAEVGGTGIAGEGTLAGHAALERRDEAVVHAGDVGRTLTPLRPSGRADFDGAVVDVQSPGRFVDAGAAVRVLRVDRYVVEVEEVDE